MKKPKLCVSRSHEVQSGQRRGHGGPQVSNDRIGHKKEVLTHSAT